MAVWAIEHSFSDYPPRHLYVDTDILIAALITTEPQHARCRDCLPNVIAIGLTTVYVSAITWLEYLNVIKGDAFRQRLPVEMRQHYSLERWQEKSVRASYFTDLLDDFEQLFRQFKELIEISLVPEVRIAAIGYAVEYDLRRLDAVHLASAIKMGIFDFASLDGSFRRVDNLHLWNDLIHVKASG